MTNEDWWEILEHAEPYNLDWVMYGNWLKDEMGEEVLANALAWLIKERRIPKKSVAYTKPQEWYWHQVHSLPDGVYQNLRGTFTDATWESACLEDCIYCNAYYFSPLSAILDAMRAIRDIYGDRLGDT